MKMTTYTVNDQGLEEIKEFLIKNHKEGNDYFSREMLLAWAAEAEFQLAEGNPPSIELHPWESVNGCTLEFTISNAGLDAEIVEIEE